MVTEREAGQILEGIKNLNKRYGNQETRLDALSAHVSALSTSFAVQPGKCQESFEEKFATKEQIKPLEELCGAIKRGAVYLLLSTLSCAVGVVLFIKVRL